MSTPLKRQMKRVKRLKRVFSRFIQKYKIIKTQNVKI
tara:strand:- start:929 stop:1039 length:111 start_codon:yes stop_codon:yes gene_type:complete